MIRNNLKELRLRKMLYQKHVAKELGISTYTLKRWESGKTFPSYKNIQKIFKFYKINSVKVKFGNEKNTNQTQESDSE